MRRVPWIALAAAVVSGTALLVRNRTLNIAADEAYALETSSGSFAHTVRRSLRFEMQPAGYFILLNAWRRINGSLAFSRLFSVVFVFAALAPLDRTLSGATRRTRERMLALFLLHPVTTFYGSEAKAYSLTVCLNLWLIDLADRIGSRPAMLRFSLVAAAAINVQYYSAFLIAGLVLRAAAERRWHEAFRLSVAALPAAISILPTLRALPDQLSTAEVQYEDAIHATRTIVNRLASFIVPIRERRRAIRIGLDAAVLATVTLLVLRSPSRRAALSQQRGLVLCGSVALLHAAARTGVGAPLNFPNQMTVLYAAFIRAVGDIATVIDRDATLLERIAPNAILGALALRTALFSVYPGAQRGDWKRVAQSIMADEMPHEPIFVFNCEEAVAFRHHYAGRNTVVPLPRPMSDDVWDPTRRIVSSVDDIERAMQEPGAFASCWLAMSESTDYLGLELRSDLIERYISEQFAVVSERRFYHSTLRRLERRRRPVAAGPTLAVETNAVL